MGAENHSRESETEHEAIEQREVWRVERLEEPDQLAARLSKARFERDRRAVEDDSGEVLAQEV